MREISTKLFDVGEHVMIDGVEYVTEASRSGCIGCAFRECPRCSSFIECMGIIFKKVEEEPKLMTYRQLSEWLARGNGQARFPDGQVIYPNLAYNNCWDESPIKYLIRPWGSDEWIKPTVDIYERDCKHE